MSFAARRCIASTRCTFACSASLAATDPDRLIEQRDGYRAAPEDPADARDGSAEAAAEDARETPPTGVEVSNWFDVLGVARSATIDDIRLAYKLLVKQNHPDCVHSMAPAFKQLAEAETKKLNFAYAQALSFFRQDEGAMMYGLRERLEKRRTNR